VRCYHIHITGRVQGVGFRPFIYRLANVYKGSGWVSNTLNGVHIEIEGLLNIEDFCYDIKHKCPPQARIEKLSVREINISKHGSFLIVDSDKEGKADMQVTPDFAICPECRNEINDPANRRFNYPFTTCTNCGPRFSIMRKLPYDRHLTTMESFAQCKTCSEEFHDPEDCRFYSQTNSCPNCSIHLSLYDKDKRKLNIPEDQIIENVAKALLSGKIVAIKGIGGYLLCADATSEGVIKTLRERKKRPAKPFALMYPDKAFAAKDALLTEDITNEWESPESPIVLCLLKQDFSSGIKFDQIAPGLNRVGIMLPYAPLFVMLMDMVRRPIIATSGNVSGSPIIYRDEEAIEILSDIADLIVTNDREIVVPQDDSVIQYSDTTGQRIILRRSRGMAPSFNSQAGIDSKEEVLAMGAMLKSTFGMIYSNRYYISQYLGDTSTLESQISYESTLHHMMQLLSFTPSTVLTDAHPDYPSSLLGDEIAKKFGSKVIKIQHHEAHSYAVLSENALIHDKCILSVVWDGTGYGDDGQIWGGECFEYRNYSHVRIGQWQYYPHILGDKMSLEPRISALSLVWDIAEAESVLFKKFTENEIGNYRKILSKNNLKTSSVGRIFDAVSSLLEITDYNTFEGEAAMKLEAVAIKYLEDRKDFKESYSVFLSDSGIIKTSELFSGIVADMIKGCESGYIAAKFHMTLVQIIGKFLSRFNYQKVVFSGGVFQNNLLVDLIIRTLSDKYSVYFHKHLSSNDECIPFGQLTAYQVLRNKQK
jgi:hydrogenase maturation protein HypF